MPNSGFSTAERYQNSVPDPHKKIVKLKNDLFNTNIIDYLWEILREINVIITCFLLETKITKDFANSSLAVLRTWSQSFQTFSSQKQAAYEHSAAGGTKFMMSRSRDDRIFPSSEPVEDWWVSLAAELLEATEAGPPPVDALADEGLLTLLGELLGFSAIEVIVYSMK